MSDALARKRAVREYHTNFVVVAGAGTGKTSLLVERVLNQLIETDLAVTQFAAITFTEKAAAELRMRIEAGLARIVELVQDPAARESLNPKREADRSWLHLVERVPLDTLRKRAESHQSTLVHATISTIHGFCSGLLRQFPVEAGVDPDFRVDDGLLFNGVRRSLWQDYLGDAHGPDGEQAERWQRVLARLDLPEIEGLAFALSGFDLPILDEVPKFADLLRPLIDEQVSTIETCSDSAAAPSVDGYLSIGREALRRLTENGFEDFHRAVDELTYARRKKEDSLKGSAPSSTKAPDGTRAAKQLSRFVGKLRRVDDALLHDALEITRPFAELVRRAARERAILPFDALLALTRDMLAEYPGVRRTLDLRYRALFVDEFQDTNPLQYEIVFFLSEPEDELPAADAFQTRLAPGKLFIVGDPKQAIYRFRGADIHAYHAAVKHVEASGGEQLALTTSWRAVPELLSPLDRLFRGLLTPDSLEEEDAYSGYDPLESGRDAAADGPRVEVWTVGDVESKRRAQNARRDEATAIADWLAQALDAGEQRPGDVAILFRALGDVRIYTRALADRGVPFAVESGRDALDRPEGKQLQALLRALAHPGDGPAVLGVLRSPLGGVRDDELARYAAAGRRNWSYLTQGRDAQAFPDLARCFAWLARRHAELQSVPLDAFLCSLADDEPMLALQAASEDGEQRVQNLRALLDPLIELARAEPRQDLAALVGWLEDTETNRRRNSPAKADAVRIMSIHAAKGLEFPTVLLPDLGRDPSEGGSFGPRTELAWLADAHSLAVHTPAAISSTWVPYEQQEQLHLDAESRRLFYVACTRAQERLLLVHAPRKTVGGGAIVHYLNEWGYKAEGLPAGEELAEDLRAVHLSEAEALRTPPAPREPLEVRDGVRRARRLAEEAQERARPPFRSPTGLREDQDAEQERDEPTPGRRAPKSLGREVGLVLHDLMERWDFVDAERARVLLERAVQTHAPAELVDRLRDEAGRVLDTLLEGALPDYLAGVEVVARELPLLFQSEDGAWSGTLDLLYLDPDGRMVISDYKTDRKPDDATRERYRAQLEVYAQAIRQAFPDQPEPALELIYLRRGERLRLPPAERTIGE